MKKREEILAEWGVQFPASRSPRDFNLTLIAMEEYAQQSVECAAASIDKDKDVKTPEGILIANRAYINPAELPKVLAAMREYADRYRALYHRITVEALGYKKQSEELREEIIRLRQTTHQ
jgi:hypothetical protein